MLYLLGALDDAAEEEDGDLFHAALLELVAAGKSKQSASGLWYGGEESAELGELG